MPAVKDTETRSRRADLGRVPCGVARLLARLAGCVALSVALLSGTFVPHEASARELTVRSSTSLRAEVTPHGRRPRLRARLVDNVHQGIADAELTLSVESAGGRVVERHTLTTDALGYARLELELEDGQYMASLSYAGSAALDPSAASVALESRRAPLDLEIEAPHLVHVGQDTTLDVSLRGTAPFRVDERPVVELVVGRGEAAVRKQVELVPTMASASALVTGRGQEIGEVVRLRARDLPRGRQPIAVAFAGNALFEPDEATARVHLFRAPRMRFAAELVRERDRRGLAMSGSLESQDGPLRGARVVAEVADGRGGWDAVGEVLTERDGHFAGFVPLERLPTGAIKLRAVFVPDAGGALRSDPLALDVDPGGATEWISSALVVLMLVVVGALALVYAFTLLRGAWSAWRRKREPIAPVAEAELVALEPPPGRALPALDAIAGQLFDAIESRPVHPGRVRLVPAGASREAASLADCVVDARGWFSLSDLPPGRWRLWGQAHGYMSGFIELSIPHHGRHRAFRFDLVPVRRRVRDIYLWLLDRYSPDETLWGKLTPREVEHRLVGEVDALLDRLGAEISAQLVARARAVLEAPRPGLGELVDTVTQILEEVYYSDRTFGEEVAQLVEQLAERLREPLSRAGGRADGLGAAPPGRAPGTDLRPEGLPR